MFSKIKYVDVIDYGKDWLTIKRNKYSGYLEDECGYIIEKYSTGYGYFEIEDDEATIYL